MSKSKYKFNRKMLTKAQKYNLNKSYNKKHRQIKT